MVSLAEIEAQAMDLSQAESVTLAYRLLKSIPGGLNHDDEGIAEALRRETEMNADPSMHVTFEELNRSVGR